MTVRKFSRQRQSILEYLMQTTAHPTAETVYLHVREQYPNISLGTVYRNLNLLAEEGKIVRLTYGGSERFDGNLKPHNHFICKTCGNVLDLEISSLEHINTLAGVGFGGRVEGHIIYFYGVCEECLKRC